ncbi:hypothetical protein IAR50_002800 [Cryptococcus sp. DSM 104548]
MASIEDLIATLNGVHAGKQGNDIRELHAKLSQTINHPIQPPIYRPVPPSTSNSNSIAAAGMPPPAPASSWNTPPPNTGFFLSGSPLGGVNGEGGFHPTGGGGPGANGERFGYGGREENEVEGTWPSVPLPNRAFAQQPAYPSNSQYQYPSNPFPPGEPLNHMNGDTGGGGANDGGTGVQQEGMEEDRPYHAAVLPVKASPKDTGGFTEDAFKPLWESSGRDQWGGFRQGR